MLAKFIIIAITVEVLLSQNEAMAKCVSVPCPQWVKLNRSPVCFGARGNQYGSFTTFNRNIFVSSFMFVHRSGTVSCAKSEEANYSYWGCYPNPNLSTILTDQQNSIMAPAASKVDSAGWYNLAGYNSTSSILVFCAPKKPHCVLANSELRLWYGEDLRDHTESDNAGKTCADVYGLLA
ncbi:hypothetical protein ACROYT_G036672 [Oculina patagonica]